ncbi:hypothetical protein N7517_006194 [Penicillium concentricum]|uniref:Uncharacterized protein n=1 Tax=Penicillium concentricum TaxID=293559 RepID=A0A9W9SDL3_9EURO|nr:uncharacterized protein N7517_006194 [Penicillium concentricum]KAJ5374188.1 hypothetical protein N7517_006194 [Penicillium concentricum]
MHDHGLQRPIVIQAEITGTVAWAKGLEDHARTKQMAFKLLPSRRIAQLTRVGETGLVQRGIGRIVLMIVEQLALELCALLPRKTNSSAPGNFSKLPYREKLPCRPPVEEAFLLASWAEGSS